MVQVGFGLGDLLFLLDLAAYLTLFFIAKGWTVDWDAWTTRPFLVTFLAVLLSLTLYSAIPPVGVALFFASTLGLYLYYTFWAEEIVGFFYEKPFLFVASLPLFGSFVGMLAIYAAMLLGALPAIPWLLTLGGLYVLFLSKGLLIAITVWVLEKANINRLWALGLGLFGYIGLLAAALIAKQRGKL